MHGCILWVGAERNGSAADDERSEVLNSLSDSHEVQQNGNPQGSLNRSLKCVCVCVCVMSSKMAVWGNKVAGGDSK